MELKAVVFDLGGTLIAYTGAYDKWPELETPGFMAAYNYLKQCAAALPNFLEFRDAGFELLPGRWAAASAGERNLRLVDLLDEVLQACGVDSFSEPEVERAAEAYQNAVTAQASLLPGAFEALSYARTQGYKIGLLSNTMFTGAAHIKDLDRFGLTRFFDTMLFSADANKWKPTTAPFEHVLKVLGVGPEEAVHIGDDPVGDIVGGCRAGLHTIQLRDSKRYAEPDGARPSALINSVVDLPGTLESWANGRT